jgi:hypothetical protein
LIRYLCRVLIVLLPFAGAAGAHEIGTTQVRLTLHRDQTWTALITTAPQTLVNRLEAEAGEPASRDLSAEALRAKLDGFRTGWLATSRSASMTALPPQPSRSMRCNRLTT